MNIAIMGFGVVGSGVAEVIARGAGSITGKAGEEIKIKYILDLRDFPGNEFEGKLTKDFNDILSDPDVGIVVETMGGCEPAYTYTKQLLLAGKHVVTSNKELVARHGTELLAVAKENNLNYMFEASVGGGIPIIRPLNSCLAANELTEIIGILNGTTNYILTQMIKNDLSFEAALKSAQGKGYAERDPSADIEGHDTCRKIAILASLAFGKFVDSDRIYTEGITKITLDDIEYANKMGSVIKLVGTAKKAGGGVYARVSPVIISKEHTLAGIEDVFNGIMVKGDAIGDVMFYGRGAGKLPTASAVVADVIDIVKHKDKNTRLMWESSNDNYLLSHKEQEIQYFLRLNTKETAQAMSDIGKITSGCEFVVPEGRNNELGVVLPFMKERELDEIAVKISNLASINEISSNIRLMR